MAQKIKRPTVVPEQLFLGQIELLIKNLFITNPNLTNGYYNTRSTNELITDNKERAQWIIDEMERTKHLINLGVDTEDKSS